MIKKLIQVIFGLILGACIGYTVNFYYPIFDTIPSGTFLSPTSLGISQKEVIGFLPYWLLGKNNTDYSKYITELSYFDLTINTDGSIEKQTDPGEDEPGWYTLASGKANSELNELSKNGVRLSLVVFLGDNDSIDNLMSDPTVHAKTLMDQVVPIMEKYRFTDLNVDIESTTTASDSARLSFTEFIKTVKANLNKNHLGTLTIDISPTDFIRHDLIYPRDVSKFADYVVLMTYDYHFPGSFVTGPVSPLGGAGVSLEYDTTAAVAKALAIIPAQKIILGAPLYGYQWEALNDTPHSAVIPDSGITASNMRVEDFLSTCASCSAQFDNTYDESFLTYQDQDTGTFYQFFYPTEQSTAAKTDFADKNNLGGIALWALGYEGNTILNPLENYK